MGKAKGPPAKAKGKAAGAVATADLLGDATAPANVAIPIGHSSSDRYRTPSERNEENMLGGLGPEPSSPPASGDNIVSAMPGRPLPATKDACSGSIAVEWIDDTGAGRHLSSVKHIARYFGVSPETVLKCAHEPSEEISFYTGGGSDKKAKLALTIVSKMWGRGELRLLDDCPEVRSSGMIVEELDRPRIHWPGDALLRPRQGLLSGRVPGVESDLSR